MKKYIFNKNNITILPKDPGVYIYYSNQKNPIYVGKSTNLRDRVRSYTYSYLSPKTATMIHQVTDFSYIRVDNELESLLLEARLVSKYKPFFNIQLKDDKHPLYIKITNDKYPRVVSARKNNLSDAKVYFGPFPSSTNVRSVMKILRRIFPYAQHKVGKKVCIYAQMGLCIPCPSVVDQIKDLEQKKKLRRKYLKNISFIKRTLNGNLINVRKNLEKQMLTLSNEENYEEAQKIKKQIEMLDYITQPKIPINEYLKNPNLFEDQRNDEIEELSNIVNKFIKIKKPVRIECFDVAHISGSQPTASMVTFINGESDKSLYRHFKIKQKKGNSDTDSLSEVIKRRRRHFSDWGKPDLIVVDGGKGQVSVFFKQLKKYEIPVVGLAKRFETLVFIKEKNNKLIFEELRVPAGPAKNLLQRMRNEAHRFARRLHHKLIKKELIPTK